MTPTTQRPPRPRSPYPLRDHPSSAEWRAWLGACDACQHRDAALGCVRDGVTEHAGGVLRGLATGPGGCSQWRGKE